MFSHGLMDLLFHSNFFVVAGNDDDIPSRNVLFDRLRTVIRSHDDDHPIFDILSDKFLEEPIADLFQMAIKDHYGVWL